MRKNQGITLIALIITIVIMLILATVTIDVAIDGKLFDTAKEAVDKTNDKVGETQGRADGLLGELEEVKEWEESKKPKEHNWQYTDNTQAELKCTCGICSKESTSGKTYSVGQEIPDYTAGPSGTRWVVFGTEDSDKNGRNDTLLLTTLEPSTEVLQLSGADAYNNGIEKIEAKVKEIYGNEARSMKIEDINRALGYTPEGGMYYDENGYQTTGNFTTKLNELSTWEDIKANGTYTPDGANTEEALGEYILDGYVYTMIDMGLYVSDIISNRAKNLVFEQRGSYIYWLASRGVFAGSVYACFGPGAVFEGCVNSYGVEFDSVGDSGESSCGVRPLVSLKSEIPAGGAILVSDVEYSGGGGEL